MISVLHPSRSSCTFAITEEAEFIFWVLDSNFGCVTWFLSMGCYIHSCNLYRGLLEHWCSSASTLYLCLCLGNLPGLTSPGMGESWEAKPNQHSEHQARPAKPPSQSADHRLDSSLVQMNYTLQALKLLFCYMSLTICVCISWFWSIIAAIDSWYKNKIQDRRRVGFLSCSGE